MPNALTGIALKLISVVLVVGLSALIKAIPDPLPDGEIVFFRCLFAIPFLLTWLVYRGHGFSHVISHLKPNRPGLHLLRSVFGILAMTQIFIAVRLLPLPVATTLFNLAPMTITLIAAIFLGEKIRVFRVSAILIGFIGVAIIGWDASHGEMGDIIGKTATYGVIFAIGATLAMGVAQVTIRAMIGTETATAIAFWMFVFGTLIAFLTIFLGAIFPSQAWIMPSPKGWYWLVLIGVFGFAGQIFLTESYRYAPASTIAPFDYFSIPVGIALGLFIFNEWPTPLAWIGIGLITAAGLVIILRERTLAKPQKIQINQ